MNFTPKLLALKRDPNENLVSELRSILAQAEAGEIVGIIAIKLRPDSAFAVVRIGRCSDLEMAGALAFAQHDLIAANEAQSNG